MNAISCNMPTVIFGMETSSFGAVFLQKGEDHRSVLMTVKV